MESFKRPNYFKHVKYDTPNEWALVAIGGMWLLLGFLRLVFFFQSSKLYDFMNLMARFLLGGSFLVQGFIIRKLRLRARQYHHQFYSSPITREIKEGGFEETFCGHCGDIISTQIFKPSKRLIIKTTQIWIKGYFCKKCFKKQVFHLLAFIVILIATFLLIFNMIIYQESLESSINPVLWFIIGFTINLILIIMIGLLPLFYFIRYKKYLNLDL